MMFETEFTATLIVSWASVPVPTLKSNDADVPAVSAATNELVKALALKSIEPVASAIAKFVVSVFITATTLSFESKIVYDLSAAISTGPAVPSKAVEVAPPSVDIF